jgi:hypothetical protein
MKVGRRSRNASLTTFSYNLARVPRIIPKLTEAAVISAINITETFIQSANNTNQVIIDVTQRNVTDFCSENITDAAIVNLDKVIMDASLNVTKSVFKFNTYLMRQLVGLLDDLYFSLDVIRQIQYYTTFSYWGFLVATVFICILVFFIVVVGVSYALQLLIWSPFCTANSNFLFPRYFFVNSAHGGGVQRFFARTGSVLAVC